ncbi:hypothetical protein B0H11DRAFT_1943544 [Mycena galericulata]|nr:hypothetical protein B0H11DRAFT_1943544 [Mycena galericulata]
MDGSDIDFSHWLSRRCDAQPEETHHFDVKTSIRGLKEFSIWVVRQDISRIRAKNLLVSKMLNMDNRKWLGNVLVVKRREGDWTYFDEDVEDAEAAVECVVRRAYKILLKGNSAVQINSMVYTNQEIIIGSPKCLLNFLGARFRFFGFMADGTVYSSSPLGTLLQFQFKRKISGIKAGNHDTYYLYFEYLKLRKCAELGSNQLKTVVGRNNRDYPPPWRGAINLTFRLDRIIYKADINKIVVPSKIWNYVIAKLEEYDGWTDGMLFSTWCEKPMRISVPVKRNCSGYNLADLNFFCPDCYEGLLKQVSERKEEPRKILLWSCRNSSNGYPSHQCHGSVLVLGMTAEGIRDIGFGIHQELCEAVPLPGWETQRKISEMELKWNECIRIRQEFQFS